MLRFDTVVKNGMIIDGTRAPRYRGDIGIKDGRIVEIGNLDAGDGASEIDASGLIVAPGFIDLHTHYDAQSVLGSLLLDFGMARRDLGRDRQLRVRLRPGAAGTARAGDADDDSPGDAFPMPR